MATLIVWMNCSRDGLTGADAHNDTGVILVRSVFQPLSVPPQPCFSARSAVTQSSSGSGAWLAQGDEGIVLSTGTPRYSRQCAHGDNTHPRLFFVARKNGAILRWIFSLSTDDIKFQPTFRSLKVRFLDLQQRV